MLKVIGRKDFKINRNYPIIENINHKFYYFNGINNLE